MALIVGQNSWCTVPEADTYLTEKIESEVWFELSSVGTPGQTSKQSLLISAFYWLYLAPGLNLSLTLTDVNVLNAQIEAALFLMEHYTELNERRGAIHSGLTAFTLSQKEERLKKVQINIPDYIMGMLRDYSIVNTFALLKGEYDT